MRYERLFFFIGLLFTAITVGCTSGYEEVYAAPWIHSVIEREGVVEITWSSFMGDDELLRFNLDKRKSVWELEYKKKIKYLNYVDNYYLKPGSIYGYVVIDAVGSRSRLKAIKYIGLYNIDAGK